MTSYNCLTLIFLVVVVAKNESIMHQQLSAIFNPGANRLALIEIARYIKEKGVILDTFKQICYSGYLLSCLYFCFVEIFLGFFKFFWEQNNIF
jgi:hypothetical protein